MILDTCLCYFNTFYVALKDNYIKLDFSHFAETLVVKFLVFVSILPVISVMTTSLLKWDFM